jgi:hypothetical protein
MHPDREDFHIISNREADLVGIKLFESTGTYSLPAKPDKK